MACAHPSGAGAAEPGRWPSEAIAGGVFRPTGSLDPPSRTTAAGTMPSRPDSNEKRAICGAQNRKALQSGRRILCSGSVLNKIGGPAV